MLPINLEELLTFHQSSNFTFEFSNKSLSHKRFNIVYLFFIRWCLNRFKCDNYTLDVNFIYYTILSIPHDNTKYNLMVKITSLPPPYSTKRDGINLSTLPDKAILLLHIE